MNLRIAKKILKAGRGPAEVWTDVEPQSCPGRFLARVIIWAPKAAFRRYLKHQRNYARTTMDAAKAKAGE